jgi:hypothetical protein
VRAITLHAPYATLLVTRQPCDACDRGNRYTYDGSRHAPPMVKQWETRTRPCPPELLNQRVAFYQDDKPPAMTGDPIGDWWVTRYDRDNPDSYTLCRVGQGLWEPVPLGRIVGSGIITESLRITDRRWMPDNGEQVTVNPATGSLRHCGSPLSGVFDDISDQLPYGDWTPGRWAWRITEAAPTTERCPWCWGYSGWHGQGEERAFYGCPVCDGAGRCDPIPATGKQGWWDWSPT